MRLEHLTERVDVKARVELVEDGDPWPDDASAGFVRFASPASKMMRVTAWRSSRQ